MKCIHIKVALEIIKISLFCVSSSSLVRLKQATVLKHGMVTEEKSFTCIEKEFIE